MKVRSLLAIVGATLVGFGLPLAWERGGYGVGWNFEGQTRNVVTPHGPPALLVLAIAGGMIASIVWWLFAKQQGRAGMYVLALALLLFMLSGAKLLFVWGSLLPAARVGPGAPLVIVGSLVAFLTVASSRLPGSSRPQRH